MELRRWRGPWKMPSPIKPSPANTSPTSCSSVRIQPRNRGPFTSLANRTSWSWTCRRRISPSTPPKKHPQTYERRPTHDLSALSQTLLFSGTPSIAGQRGGGKELDATGLLEPVGRRRSLAPKGPGHQRPPSGGSLPHRQNPRTVQLDLAQKNQSPPSAKPLPAFVPQRKRQCHLHGRSGPGKNSSGHRPGL